MRFWSKKNTNYPDFWKNYLSLFTEKIQKQTIGNTRFIAFDTETTGFDYSSDRILSIGAIAIKNNAIDVSDQLEIYLEQEIFNKNTVEIHGIRKNNDLAKITEKEALKIFITYIGNSVLIAHHAEFDRKMINKALARQGLGALKNKVLDTGVLFKNTKHLIYLRDKYNTQYSLDELCNDLKISRSDRHTASGDAFITAIAFLKILAKLQKNLKTETKYLFKYK